jgi:hypothetical protein
MKLWWKLLAVEQVALNLKGAEKLTIYENLPSELAFSLDKRAPIILKFFN